MITRLLCTGLPTSAAHDAKNIGGWATSFQKGGGRFATDTMAPFDAYASFGAVAARENSGQEINAWIPMKQDAESVMDSTPACAIRRSRTFSALALRPTGDARTMLVLRQCPELSRARQGGCPINLNAAMKTCRI